jgi:UDP-N-acetylmuramoyl-tripeptide--D-alanyl-D-alanine ligase
MMGDPLGIIELLQATGGRFQAEVVVVAGTYARATAAELVSTVLAGRFLTLRASNAPSAGLAGQRTLPRLDSSSAKLVLEVELEHSDDLDLLLEQITPRVLLLTGFDDEAKTPTAADTQLALYAALVQAIPSSGTILVNADDHRLSSLNLPNGPATMRFGLGPSAELRATNTISHGLDGIDFDLALSRRQIHVRLPWLGRGVLHAALAGAAVGLSLGRELAEVGAALQASAATSRILVEAGLNDARLLDDTFNARPASDLEILNLLTALDGRNIAVLGDMLGLEEQEEIGHRKVGNRAALVADRLVTVGERARMIADEARGTGLRPAAVLETASNEEATDQLRSLLQAGDIVLLKAAPELELGRVVQALRAER